MSKSISGYLLIFFFLKAFNTLCQANVSGLVVDSEDKPIPYAHVILQNTSIGTITNQLGQFRLSINSNEFTSIKITCIGYKSMIIEDLQELKKIVLEEETKLLSQIIVTPRDFAREIVIKAIQNIPKNYPLTDERLRGFVREKVYWFDFGEPIYVAEAVVEAIKKSYESGNAKGTVRLVEGRKYESMGIDSLPNRIYAGPHHMHRFDIVSRRDLFLKKPESYKYLISDTLRLNGQDLFKIHFVNERKGHEGFVYILDSTYAISKADIVKSKFSSLLSLDRDRKVLKYTVNYENSAADKKWRINHTEYYTVFSRGMRDLVLESQYATTYSEPNMSEIPYLDRIQFTDIYLEKTGTYNPDFWDKYNIVLPNNNIEDTFRKGNETRANQNRSLKITKKSIYDLLSKMKLGYGFTLQNMQIRNYSFSYTNATLEIQQAENSSEQLIWGLSSFFLYEFKPNTFIGLITESPITKTGITSYDLSISKDFNLNPNGRPIKISPGLRLGYQHLDQFIDNYATEEGYEVNGKSFDSGSTDIFLTQKQIHFQPNMMLSIEKSNRISFYTSINYNLPFDRSIGLTFREKDEFLFGKKQFLKNGNEGMSVSSDDNDLLTSRINFNVGVFLTF